MKHFIVTLMLNVPSDQLGPRQIFLHEQHFRAGYELGIFLFHGPLSPPHGWLAIARSESRKTLDTFLEGDPLLVEHLASVAIQQFQPAEFPRILGGWVNPLGTGMNADYAPIDLSWHRSG